MTLKTDESLVKFRGQPSQHNDKTVRMRLFLGSAMTCVKHSSAQPKRCQSTKKELCRSNRWHTHISSIDAAEIKLVGSNRSSPQAAAKITSFRNAEIERSNKLIGNTISWTERRSDSLLNGCVVRALGLFLLKNERHRSRARTM